LSTETLNATNTGHMFFQLWTHATSRHQQEA